VYLQYIVLDRAWVCSGGQRVRFNRFLSNFLLILIQESHHEMRIPDRAVTHHLICLLTNVYPKICNKPEAGLLAIKLTWVHWRHVNLNLTLQNIIQHTDVRIADLWWGPTPYHLPGNVIFGTVAFVYINLQPVHELSSSTRFGHFEKFGNISVGGIVLPSHP